MAMNVDRDVDFNPAMKEIIEKLEKIDKELQEFKNRTVPTPTMEPKKKVN